MTCGRCSDGMILHMLYDLTSMGMLKHHAWARTAEYEGAEFSLLRAGCEVTKR